MFKFPEFFAGINSLAHLIGLGCLGTGVIFGDWACINLIRAVFRKKNDFAVSKSIKIV